MTSDERLEFGVGPEHLRWRIENSLLLTLVLMAPFVAAALTFIWFLGWLFPGPTPPFTP